MAKQTSPKPATGKPRIGAHVSTAGHIDVAAENAQALGVEAVQIFGASPQQWRRKEHAPDHIAAYREKMRAAKMGPSFIHAIYLINLASADRELAQKGVDALIADLRLGSALGIAGVIFHVGSHKGAGFEAVLPQIAAGMREALAESPEDIWLCIENNAGTGNSVGSKLTEIGAMMDAVGSTRMKVCMDTCHMHASGYDIADAAGLRAAMREFDQEVGREHLVAVHANDSKTPLGSGKDRHENIGQGSIGLEAFERIIRHPIFRSSSWLLEVPGFEGGGPDVLNVEILRALRDGTAIPKIPVAHGKTTVPRSAAKRTKRASPRAKRASTARR